jgi:hypothetical protein
VERPTVKRADIVNIKHGGELGSVDWMGLVEDWKQCRAFVEAVMMC